MNREIHIVPLPMNFQIPGLSRNQVIVQQPSSLYTEYSSLPEQNQRIVKGCVTCPDGTMNHQYL